MTDATILDLEDLITEQGKVLDSLVEKLTTLGNMVSEESIHLSEELKTARKEWSELVTLREQSGGEE
mgnify:FL=1